MSQHYFNATTSDGMPVVVLTGWDRPLSGFFLVISHANTMSMNDQELYSNGLTDGYLFSNLDYDGEAHPKDFDAFTGILNSYGITLPQPMLDDLLLDKEFNAGNKMVEWN